MAAAGSDIHAQGAWDVQNTAPYIIVAVIDTGARLIHEDLWPNLFVNPGETGLDSLGRDKRTNGVDDDCNGYIDDVYGINALTTTGTPDCANPIPAGNPNNVDNTSVAGHGTHVSGIIGAKGNNDVGVVGVCWGVQIMICRFLDSNGTGSTSDAIECINYVTTMKQNLSATMIINASWGDYLTAPFNGI